MKFVSIYLSNYIGIYNGMGLSEIHIDMTKCRNRITIIRGDNGSGKSTLSKAMSLFPDSGDSFIPGLPARKEIVLQDGETLYKLVFIHSVRASGERENTKAYITKTFMGQAVELNENGNVTSYKDILYNELGLDSNFFALSQLSNEDRGLADKRPADRKRFVNSIISSLETYNNIYKTLSKRSSNFKSMINAVVAKLNILGDEKTINDNLEALEAKINIIQDSKDQAVAELAKEQSTIQILDPDRSIQNLNTTVIAELELAEKDAAKIRSIIESLISSNAVDTDLEAGYKKTIDTKNSLIIQNQIDRNSIDALMCQKESEADELSRKLQRLHNLMSEHDYDSLQEKLSEYKETLDSIKLQFENAGIPNFFNIGKDEYIIALETLKELEQQISSFKSGYDFVMIQKIVSEYLSTGKVPERINPRLFETTAIDTQINNAKNEQIAILSKMSLLGQLELRPSDCVNDICPFIKEAVEFSKTKPKKRNDELDAMVYELEAEKQLLLKEADSAYEMNNALNQFAVIVREVDKNGAILSKMPNGEMFKNKLIFFERLINGYSFEYMREIYKYIDLANLFDVYKHTEAIYKEYLAEMKSYEGKVEIIKSLNEDITLIHEAIDSISDKIEPIQQGILDREIRIAQLQELEGVYDSIFAQQDKLKPITDTIAKCRSILLENNRKMNEINISITKAEEARKKIQEATYKLVPLMQERDKALHSVQMMKDYIKERDELQQNYEFIETIKFYSSPTTGIQLIFMELYMGKIIALANELLALLFKGQYAIQPFVINETEFRIPCLGNGYINDDISSMSSAQIGMISMILSFALLHHSSSKYNIIKLDEIDGPLDYSNRMYFIDVLNKIMDIMGVEQCIMISHNSELPVDNSDVILLKHDENISDYDRGNIIWRF